MRLATISMESILSHLGLPERPEALQDCPQAIKLRDRSKMLIDEQAVTINDQHIPLTDPDLVDKITALIADAGGIIGYQWCARKQ